MLHGNGFYYRWDNFCCYWYYWILYDPGTPQDCYSIFLSDEEIRIARRRMKADQKDSKPRENAVKYFSIKIFGKNFSSWHFYVLSLWNIFVGIIQMLDLVLMHYG